MVVFERWWGTSHHRLLQHLPLFNSAIYPHQDFLLVPNAAAMQWSDVIDLVVLVEFGGGDGLVADVTYLSYPVRAEKSV